MEAIVEKKQRILEQENRFEKLFPSDEVLNQRLVNVMRTPVCECIDKHEMLDRLNYSAHV